MSNKALGKPLTKQLIFTKTKTDSLHNIKNLNLWGSQLEDLAILQQMPNLQVVSLSVNKINSLKSFQKCYNLQELYLRKNNVQLIHQIKYLTKLPLLKVLWLCDNPCAQVSNYRQIVIKHLPNLVKLDNDIVTPEQRVKSQKNSFYIQNNSYHQSVQNQENNIQKFKNSSSKQQQKIVDRQRNYSQKQERHNQKNQRNQKNERNQKNQRNQKNKKQYRQSQINYRKQQRNIQKNQNILMAVLSLLQELDASSLQIVRREAEKLMKN